jgi:hypothetical protein
MGPVSARSLGLVAAVLGSLALGPPATIAQTPKAKAKPGAKDTRKKDSDKDIQLEKELLKATRKVETAHAKALDGVASWAATNGLKEDAEKLAARVAALDPAYPGLAKLKEKVGKATAGDAAKAEENRKTLAKKVEAANEENAKRLFGLAQGCMKLGLFTRAYDVINAVVEADPDHKGARDILSYARDPESKAWVSKWEYDMRNGKGGKKKHVLTPEGWVPAADKKKWDMGLREFEGKWIAKDEEARLRKRNVFNPFKVQSEHFEVRTNLGREKAYEFTVLLEDFYREFFRFFIGYYDQVAGAKLLFNQGKPKKHAVMLFPSKVDYLNWVKSEKGNNKLARESAGVYMGEERSSFFYWTGNDESVLSTLYHEVTHQLLDETKEGNRGGSQGNNWVVEGIATYMETWEKVDGKWKPGHNVNAPELQAGKSILANQDFKLRSFIAIDYQQFHDAGRGANYALSGALCHFLIHYQDGIYKEDFVSFLSAYYAGKVNDMSLPEYIDMEGITAPDAKLTRLEQEFKEYMAKLGEEPAAAAAAPAGDADTKEPAGAESGQ